MIRPPPRSPLFPSPTLSRSDCGTSGGVWGLDRGYCLMIGGETEPVRHLDPIWKSIAPGRAAAEPTPSRTHADGTPPDGYLHRSEEHTSELQSRLHLVCPLLL